MDTKSLVIHSVRLVHAVGSTSYYESKHIPTARDGATAFIERDGDVGLWITDSRGRTYWTPLVNALEVEWGKPRIESAPARK